MIDWALIQHMKNKSVVVTVVTTKGDQVQSF